MGFMKNDNFTQLFNREDSLAEIDQILVVDSSEKVYDTIVLKQRSLFSKIILDFPNRIRQDFTNHFKDLNQKILKFLKSWRSSLSSLSFFQNRHDELFDYRRIFVLKTRMGRFHGFDTLKRQIIWSVTIETYGKFLGMTLTPSDRHENISEVALFYRCFNPKNQEDELVVFHVCPKTGDVMNRIPWPFTNLKNPKSVYALSPMNHSNHPQTVLLSDDGSVCCDSLVQCDFFTLCYSLANGFIFLFSSYHTINQVLLGIYLMRV